MPKVFTALFIFLNCSGCKLSNWKLCYFYYSVFQQHPGCCKPIAISGIYWGNCRITWVGADTIQCKLLVGYSYNLTAITSHVKLVMEHDQLLSCSDSSGIKMTPCWCVILFSQEIRTAAIRTLTALVHMECSPRYAKKNCGLEWGWKMFVILASWKFCVEKNCDQGLGNVAATPAYNLLIYLSLPKFCNTI